MEKRCKTPQQHHPRSQTQKEEPRVSAIDVVYLARELKRHSIVDFAQIQAIDRRLADRVVELEEGRDISELMEGRYPESWMITLWQLVDANPLAIDIGARIGAAIVSPEAQGLLISLLQHCENLGEALDTYLANTDLDNPSESWQLTRTDSRIQLTFRFVSGKRYPRCAVVYKMVSLCHWAKYLSGQEIPIYWAEFAFPKPRHMDALAARLPCELRFGSDRNSFVLPAKALSLPLPQRNRHLKGILEQRISSLGFPGKEHSVEKRVRELLRENLAAYNSIDSLTQALCMSRVTLYRKLREAKTSFSRLLDEERQQLFARYRHRSVAQLCDLLGFRDASAYYKARKRWSANLD